MKIIEGKSISNVKGFRACGCSVGLKRSGKPDMALIVSDVPAVCAATFTTNVVKAAPVLIDMEQVKNPVTKALIINSGNANACTGDQGMADGRAMAAKTAECLGIDPAEVMIYSTGVIGQQMPMDTILSGIEKCASSLVEGGGDNAQKAIMTTDTREKMIYGEIQLSGKTVSVCGIAKGSGMIHPNMATMLSYVVTDAAVTKEMLTKMHKEIIPDTFNMVTVDGDTSTNDTATVIANGEAGNQIIDCENQDYNTLKQALYEVNEFLAKSIAADGEGATKLIEVQVTGAESKQIAVTCAKSIAGSSLVKAAIYGADANWGRILCAMGYSGVQFDITKVDVEFKSEAGEILVFDKGTPVAFDEDRALEILKKDIIVIAVSMGAGPGKATGWGCDLTEEYVHINGSYRS